MVRFPPFRLRRTTNLVADARVAWKHRLDQMRSPLREVRQPLLHPVPDRLPVDGIEPRNFLYCVVAMDLGAPRIVVEEVQSGIKINGFAGAKVPVEGAICVWGEVNRLTHCFYAGEVTVMENLEAAKADLALPQSSNQAGKDVPKSAARISTDKLNSETGKPWDQMNVVKADVIAAPFECAAHADPRQQWLIVERIQKTPSAHLTYFYGLCRVIVSEPSDPIRISAAIAHAALLASSPDHYNWTRGHNTINSIIERAPHSRDHFVLVTFTWRRVIDKGVYLVEITRQWSNTLGHQIKLE